MNFPLYQRWWHSKESPSSIHSRRTSKYIDLNSVVDLHMSKEKYPPPTYPWTLVGEAQLSTILVGDSVGICWCRNPLGDTDMSEGRILLFLCYHITAIDAIPPPCLTLQKCFSNIILYKRDILGGWLHVIINLQPLIPDKYNFFWPIGGVESASLNMVP